MFVVIIISVDSGDFNGQISRKSMKQVAASGGKLCMLTNKTVKKAR